MHPRAINLAIYGTILIFVIFVIVAFASSDGMERGMMATSAKMEFAFSWTLRAVGTLLAAWAALQLVAVAGQRDSVDQLVPSSIALLGALSLLSFNWTYHWTVVVAFGVLALAFIGQQLLLRPRWPAEPLSTTPLEPSRPPSDTGFQAH